MVTRIESSLRGKKKILSSQKEIWAMERGRGWEPQPAEGRPQLATGHSAGQVASVSEKGGVTRTAFEPSLLAVIFRRWEILGKSVSLSGRCFLGMPGPQALLEGFWGEELEMGPERRKDVGGSSGAGKTFQTKKLVQAKMWNGAVCLENPLKGELFLRLHHSQPFPV